MLPVSVIICSHNPRAAYLARTLHSLQAQILDASQWELLLIDNRSSSPLSDAWTLDWHPNARHVREPQLGLTPARVRGIIESRGELLVFVDDDNVLAPDYLQSARAIAERCPDLGAFGAGALEPEFEVTPPAQLHPWLSRLALRTVSAAERADSWAAKSSIPWGAGLCVTRSIAAAYMTLVEHLNVTLLDRCGDRLFCGGDDLFSFVACDQGLSFGIFPALRITHLIASVRLNERYMLRLIHDHAYSHTVLNHRLSGELPHLRYGVDKIRAVLHGVRHGSFAMKARLAELRGVQAAMAIIGDRPGQPLAGKVHENKQTSVAIPIAK